MAILVTGFSFPGFLLPLLNSNERYSAGSNKNSLSFVTGNSKAFSVEPIDGVTISAEENAFDKDRSLSMTELSYEETVKVCESYERIFPEDPAILFGVWDFDAGLEEDEILPGSFKMEFDLDTLGIDKENYDYVRVYRIDDSGKWYEYVTNMEDDKLTVYSNKNCILALAGGYITWKGVLLGTAIVSAVGGVMFYKRDEAKALAEGAYMRKVDEFEVVADGEMKYKIHIDPANVRELIYKSSTKYADTEEAVHKRTIKKAFIEAIEESDLKDDEKKTAVSRITDDLTLTTANTFFRDVMFKEEFSTKDKSHKKYADILRAGLAKENDLFDKEIKGEQVYTDFQESLDKILKNKDTLEKLRKSFEQVDKTVDYLIKAHVYLKKVLKVKMPHYVMDVHLSEKANENYGQVIVKEIGNPYMIIYYDSLSDGTAGSYEQLLLTICHELFHAVQREYVSARLCNLGYDEMCAQMLEWDAYRYFHDNHIISGSEEASLVNLKSCSNFAIPLNEYAVTYPEGTLGDAKGSKVSDAYYPRAPFLKYLRGKKISSNPYDSILNKYKGMWSRGKVTSILKETFNKDDKSLTEAFYSYAKDDQSRFYKAVKGNGDGVDKVFSPELYIQSTKRDVKLPNKSYTIRVRRVKIDHKNNSDKQYALVLRENDNFKDVMSDLKFLPMNMEIKKDYVEYKEGLFFKPKDFPKDVSIPALYLMEIDGGTSKTSDTGSGYSVCMLIPPDVKSDLAGDKLTIQPMKWPDFKKDIVDSVVVSAYYGKQIVLQEQIMYEGWKKPYTVDLGTITIDGKPLTSDQMSRLKIQVQECVKGTFDKEGKTSCLGPSRDIETGIDIAGTWDVDISFNFASSVIDPNIERYQGAVKRYEDLYGSDSISGLSDLGEMYKGMQKDYRSKAKLIIKPAMKLNNYEATFKYTTGAPDETYDGVFDPATMELLLHPRDKNVTDSKGKTYNLAEYGLQSDITMRINAERSKSGEVSLTLEGETYNDPKNKIVVYLAQFTGTRVSGKYE
ncbi:MAG: hypothetical protein IKP31_03660 [Lachnospiraceae bacterium]|nr:hypothetical protein [Lachnospiraceae bacterium]